MVTRMVRRTGSSPSRPRSCWAPIEALERRRLLTTPIALVGEGERVPTILTTTGSEAAPAAVPSQEGYPENLDPTLPRRAYPKEAKELVDAGELVAPPLVNDPVWVFGYDKIGGQVQGVTEESAKLPPPPLPEIGSIH